MTTPLTPLPGAGHRPSSSLLTNLHRELARRAPFAQMRREHVDAFVSSAELTYFAPGEVIVPADGKVVDQLFYIRSGAVSTRGSGDAAAAFIHEAGELFPAEAMLAGVAAQADHVAEGDTFCLVLPAKRVLELMADSAALSAFMHHQVTQLLALSRQELAASHAARTLVEQSLETPLSQLPRREPVAVSPQTSLRDALQTMHDRRIGSLLVADDTGQALGILTRHDVLGRVSLPELALSTAVREVMTSPVHVLPSSRSALDAALLMARQGIRHLPVIEDGRVVSIVSERDLFAMNRLSMKGVGTALRSSPDLQTLQSHARSIRELAANLVLQGIGARQLTALVSQLNDLLTSRLVELVAARRQVDMSQACWLAFGSEGRSEQTIATDQDNGLIFASDAPAKDRESWLALAREVNETLDACGYPLCKGNIMASNPQCCLTPGEWRDRFQSWIDHGSPADLLNASIYFDLRPVCGAVALAAPLRELITQNAAATPRFMKQLASNALQRHPPLNWRGALDSQSVGGRAVVDLKLQGTALFVEAARVLALAHGVAQTGTRERLEALAQARQLPAADVAGWVGAFEFMQSLRLRVQQAQPAAQDTTAALQMANQVAIDELHEIDRRMLKESFRLVRQLQQRMEQDYLR